MKVLVIPDVHGSHEWEKVKSIPKEDYDFAIFLGDYFDSGIYDKKMKAWVSNNKWPDQGENFRNICNWVREDIEHRKMVFGNHDWSYVSGTRGGSSVSGHQDAHISEIRALLESNIDILDIAEEVDNFVFSHAGFTKTWVEHYLFPQLHIAFDEWPDEDKKGKAWDESEFSIKLLNEYFHKLSHTPGDKNFNYAFDETLDWNGYYSGSGDEVTQGPLWVRPNSLLSDAYFPTQVVGHTEYAFAGKTNVYLNNNFLTLVDSPTHSNIFIFDTETPGEYTLASEYSDKINKTIFTIKNSANYNESNKDLIIEEIKSIVSYNEEEIKTIISNLVM